VGDVLTIAENDMDLADGDNITVWKWWKPMEKLPTLDNSGADVTFTKDGTSYTDETDLIPPVVVMGPPECQFIDAGTGDATCKFVDERSHCLSGAAVASAVWGWDGGSEDSGAGTAADPYIVTYGTAGTYWVSCTVTDDEGKISIGWRPVFIFDANNMPYEDFESEGRQSSLDGTTQSFRILDSAPETVFFDGTWVVRFNLDYWAGVVGSNETRFPFRGHVKYQGYLVEDSLDVSPDFSTATFDTICIGGVLAQLPGFGASIKDDAAPSTWAEMRAPNIIKSVHYLLEWHTTALTCHDFEYTLPMAAAEYMVREQRWGKADILSQCQIPLQEKGVFARLASTVQGSLQIVQDPAMMKTTDRAGTVVTVVDLTTEDYSSVRISGRRHRKQIQTVRAGGFSYDGTTAIPLLSKAPGVPDPAPSEALQDGLVLSPTDGQSGLNRISGDLAAKLNNTIPRLEVTLPGNWDVFDPALQERVTVDLDATQNIRDFDFDSDDDWIVREVSIDEDAAGGFVRSVTIMIEQETDGADGETINVPEEGDSDWPSPPLPTQPPGSPTPPVNPNLATGDYAMGTDIGVVYADFDVQARWYTTNTGLTGSDELNVFDIKKDPFLWESSQRMWLLNADGLWQQDGFPTGTWVQILTEAEMRADIGLGAASMIKGGAIGMSSEVSGLMCVGAWWLLDAGMVPNRDVAFIILDEAISNSAQVFQGNFAIPGERSARWANHSGGQVCYYSPREQVGGGSAKLWKTSNRGVAWASPATSTGSGGSVSVPYEGSENTGDLYVYFEEFYSIDGGVSFVTAPTYETNSAFKGTGGHHLYILAHPTDRTDHHEIWWSNDGGLSWTALPFTDVQSTFAASAGSWRVDEFVQLLVGASGPKVWFWVASDATVMTNATYNLVDSYSAGSIRCVEKM